MSREDYADALRTERHERQAENDDDETGEGVGGVTNDHRPEFYDRWGVRIQEYPWAPEPRLSAMSAWCPDCKRQVQIDHSPQSRGVPRD